MSHAQTHVVIDSETHKITQFIDHLNGEDGHVRVSVGCGLTIDTTDNDLADDPLNRWKTLVGNNADCSSCVAVEGGADPIVSPLGFNPPVAP